jgi:hypothetical protein
MFLNPLLLFGLSALAIPPLIHLLNRRRYDVVDWGAMQFLQMSQTTRRRLLIEEILLMMLRMGLIALVVLALAGPYTTVPGLAALANRPNRDVVLIFDGSYSMGYTGTAQTPHEAAKEWALAFVNDLAAGDSVAILQAKQQVVPVLGEPTHDLERVRQVIAHLPEPRGGCDWQQALQAADAILQTSKRPERDVVILSDGQRFGWADEVTLLRWEMLASQLRAADTIRPKIWVVNLDPHRPADPPNWSLAPLRASRAIASMGQEVTFHTALHLSGQNAYESPYRIFIEVDGKLVRDLKPPTSARLDRGQVPLTFTQRFVTAGSHLVSVIVEPDPPLERRPPGYVLKDHLPGDNRQDYALEVVEALPVLLVDGDTHADPKTRGTDFLRDALSPARDRTPAVMARVVPVQDFVPAQLTRELGPKPGSRPRVLVLCNVARLTAEQQEGVAQFLAAGGGVLLTLGDRVEAAHYNEHLYGAGHGWLPARLDGPTGNEAEPDRAASPLPSSFFHPALELFRETAAGGLADARFPRWWKVTTPGKTSTAVPVALLSSNDPFLVERPYLSGRVLLCTVPLDHSWRTNLPELPAFVPLAHELVYYLGSARSAEHNLQPGQPLRLQPSGDEAPAPLTLRPPTGDSKPLAVARWPLVYEDTRETGVYRLELSNGRNVFYVVQPDHRESDLAPSSEEDRQRVAKLIPMTYENQVANMTAALTVPQQKQELWWWLMLGVIALLCGEVWLTRWIVRHRQ